MAIIQWDPFAELNSLHNQVNSLFNDTFGGSKSVLSGPATDVYSDNKGLTIEAHLPNFKEDEINIEQHHGELEITAEHKEREEAKDKKYLVKESVSSYYRRFTLPRNADSANVDAGFVNGVLKVHIPFKELQKPKKITISTKVSKSKKPK